MSPNLPPPSFFIFVYFCLIPIIPLGSHLHQCHSFLSQSRSLHTKLPLCTLPALSGVHGCSGPAEHAPADGDSADLCPARPLPASSNRVSARLPRIAALSLEACWLFRANGKCCSHRHPSPRSSASSDPARSACPGNLFVLTPGVAIYPCQCSQKRHRSPHCLPAGELGASNH